MASTPGQKADARAPLETEAALRGWVLDPDGRGIAGAVVRLTHLEGADLEWEPSWKVDEWGRVDRQVQETRTDSEGGFQFAATDAREGGDPCLLDAAAQGYATSATQFDAAAAAEPIRLVLTPAEPVRVQVVDAQGVPVAGAEVSQFGVASEEEARTRARGPGTWRRYLEHVTIADGNGLATLPRLGGEQVLVAREGSRRSLPWRGVPRGRVVLRLLPTFRLSGLVSLPDWSSLGYEGERRIRITAKRGGIERQLAALRGVDAGPYGPVELPVLPGATYTVHLEGSPIIPVRRSFDVPSADDETRVDLEAELGTPLWVLVTDMENEPIEDSRVTLRWTYEGRPNHVTRHSDADGYANMWSLPPVTFSIVASAPGYATEEFTGFELPEDGGHIPVRLVPAARVRGKCFFRGEPVTDFSVTAYADGPARWTTKQFTAREDGSFELDDAPAGRAFVIASTEDLPPSDPVAVEVREGEEAEVRIELREGWPRSGVVVDGETGKPIPHARIRRSMVAQLLAENWWGTDVLTGVDGGFRLEALPEGRSAIEVSAPGYATFLTLVDGGDRFTESPIHVALERTVSIRIQLTGLSPGSYGGFDATGQGPTGSLPMKWFSPDGVAEYPDASPGYYRIQVRGDPNARDRISASVDIHAKPRRNILVPVRVGGPNRLSVHLDLDSIAGSDDELWAQLRYRTPGGKDMLLVGPFSPEGVFEVDGIDAPSVWVEAIRRSGESLAASQGSFADGTLSLELSAEDTPFHLRVVDDHGEPLPAVYVMVIDPRTGAYGASGSTGADGTIDLRGLPRREVEVNLYSKTHGFRTAAPISGKDDGAELVLSATASLELDVQHDGTPISGVNARLLTAGNEVYYSGQTSDAQGVVTWSKLHPGTYRVRIMHPSYWQVEREVSATVDPRPIEIAMRALGDLSLRVVSSEGVAVAGLRMELVDGASGESVQEWISGDRGIDASLVTDERGECELNGLPEGQYRVFAAGGEELGEARVVGSARSEVELRIQTD
ncbi:MAG TPA: carboxypeptidase regulatory-like domain-containing protein [Planctomycetes bacterium]|nr:carboxypeptidase regulatory-like domain-containing protein [Planctomycetota bacterium]